MPATKDRSNARRTAISPGATYIATTKPSIDPCALSFPNANRIFQVDRTERLHEDLLIKLVLDMLVTQDRPAHFVHEWDVTSGTKVVWPPAVLHEDQIDPATIELARDTIVHVLDSYERIDEVDFVDPESGEKAVVLDVFVDMPAREGLKLLDVLQSQWRTVAGPEQQEDVKINVRIL